MSTKSKSKVGIKFEEQMLFKCDLGDIKMQTLYLDERRLKRTDKIGPSPVKLLALSVLGCLVASLEFCLEKKNLTLSDLEGTAEITIARNKNKFWRVKRIDIEILPKIDNPELVKKIDECRNLFEQYCIISESLKKGIEINVNLEY